MPIEFIEEVKSVISSSLPSASGIIGEVINTIYDKSSNSQDIAAVIKRDPPLTAKILKVANSAYYGSSTTITSLSRAVVTLGYETIKELVTTVSIVHYFFNSNQHPGADRPGLWLHSVGTAKASQLISENTNIEYPEKAYTLGLLHDIGKILLILSFPDQYAKVTKLAVDKKCQIIIAERELFNVDHTMIGKTLCDIWGLPEEISMTILSHHDLSLAPEKNPELAQIISLGDFMCRKAQIGNPGDNTLIEPPQTCFSILGITPEKINANFDSIFQNLLDQKQEIEDFFAGFN